MRARMIRTWAMLATIIAAATLACLAGCENCETDGDCLIICDCDEDGTPEALYPHDCMASGVCGNQYVRHVNDGCDALCEENIGL